MGGGSDRQFKLAGNVFIIMEFIQLYWVEFITIATIHLLAVASPGPDFAVVLKHSIRFGRRAAMFTSIGIGVGILVHVAYSFLGIGVLIATTPWLFDVISYVAAAYLAYLGWGALQSQPSGSSQADEGGSSNGEMSDKKALWTGLLTNGLNPKATLFFVSLFAVVISTHTPNSVKMFYGVYLAMATGIWFCALSYFLSSQQVRGVLLQHGHWFDRVMGVALILLAIKLVIGEW